MSVQRTGIGIIGAGNIATPYAQDLVTYSDLALVGVADIEAARAEKLAGELNCRAYENVDALLADPAIQIVINLTIFDAHKAVTTQALGAGKHVYSEKPLALTVPDAQDLVELAKRQNLRLGCSPMTFLGEAQQTAYRQIREGRLGQVRAVFAQALNGRIETWHPAPQAFLKVGALFDVGVYPLTLIAAFLGPAQRVTAYGRVLEKDRVTKDGHTFEIETPDIAVLEVELANGALVRLTTSYYVSSRTKQAYAVEFHGDKGSLNLANWLSFRAVVEYAEFDQEYEPVPLVKPVTDAVRWGRGVQEMAEAIRKGRPHRASAEMAAHVVEIVCAANESMQTHLPVEIRSTFTQPEPMEWA